MSRKVVADGGSASDDRSVREHSAALLRALAEHGAWGSDADFLREVVRGLADAIAQSNPDDETRALERLAHRARRAILGEVRHDLLTPLNGILGYAQLLARDPMLNASQRNAVNNVRECGERLHRLITSDRDGAPGGLDQPMATGSEHSNTTADADPLEPALAAALRATLLEFASRGDVVAVNHGLDELERQASHPRLLAELREYARAFDMQAIRERLGRTRGTPA